METLPGDRRPALQPPRYRLGSLMLLVAMLGLVFALIHYVGPYGSALVIFFLLCIVAHVAGNAIGTRLREIGSTPSTDKESGMLHGMHAGVAQRDVGPPSRLRERRSLGKPIIAVTFLGAIVGALAGGYALLRLTDKHPSYAVVVLGMVASAVLGAIWSFAAGSFIQVLVGAWLHATRAPRKH